MTEITSDRKVFDLIQMPTLEKWLHYAKWAVENKVAPKNMTVPEYFMVLQAGNDLGMDLAQIHNSLAIINGRVVMWGKEVLARAKRAGYKISYTEKSESKVIVTIERWDEKHTEIYTIEKAKKAWLTTKDIWMKYPEEMLTHKCVARAIDNFCPEVLWGFSMKEDMDDSVIIKTPDKPDLSQLGKPKRMIILPDNTTEEEAENIKEQLIEQSKETIETTTEEIIESPE